MSSEERGRSSYLDLLITTLMEHEKNLDALIEKFEKLCENLQAVYKEAGKAKKTDAKATSLEEKTDLPSGNQDTLVYLKVKINRPIDEVIRILETLKE
ncbi:hypothetical protein KEJ18_01830 [Candidatus Bathyarchaeota archaeon]|nr:hypothetical protein [Candidatus Bathyarchaeota archaeon]